MLEPFLNPATGHLDADSESAQALRRAVLGFRPAGLKANRQEIELRP
jgi:hypothetical protein